jgi:hypothetical protein
MPNTIHGAGGGSLVVASSSWTWLPLDYYLMSLPPPPPSSMETWCEEEDTWRMKIGLHIALAPPKEW